MGCDLDCLRSARMALLLLALVGVLLGCSPSDKATVGAATGSTGAVASSTVSTSGATPPAVSALEDAYTNVVQSVTPSVVEIASTTGLGSGVVYDDEGNIVTNAHVVGDETQFEVTFGDGRQLPGTLVGSYAPDDLAVVRVSGSKLPPAVRWADSSQVRVGELCLAIGNPLGLASSVTSGIVSFVGRTVSEGNGVVLPSTIQTSAPINPGNSGGALVGLDGAVIGIPTLAATDPQLGGAALGIGFAIPSNIVKLVADQLVTTGQVSHSGRAALGVSASTLVDASGSPAGVLVRSVDAGSAADHAGIVAGDVIQKVADTPTPTLADLGDVLADHQPGDSVPVDLVDANGSEKTVTVTLGELSG